MPPQKARERFESNEYVSVFCVSHQEGEMKMIARDSEKLAQLS